MTLVPGIRLTPGRRRVVAVARPRLAGCSRAPPRRTAVRESASPHVTLLDVLRRARPPGGPQTDRRAFEKDNPDINVTVQTAPYADYFTKLQTAIAGGTAPDAFELDYENFVTYASARRPARSGRQAAQRQYVTRRCYSPGVLEAFDTAASSTPCRSPSPTSCSSTTRTLFDAAGVAYPTADWTWADEKAAAEKLTEQGRRASGATSSRSASTSSTRRSPRPAARSFSADGKSGDVQQRRRASRRRTG